jgi:hypothetical protein
MFRSAARMKKKRFYEIPVFRGCEWEDDYCVWCRATSSRRNWSTFQRCLLHCRTISISMWLHFPMWWPGLKNSPTVTHACRKRRLKWVPSAWGYSWATLSPEVIQRPGPPGWGLGAGLKIQPCKNVIVKNPQQERPGPDLGCRAIWWCGCTTQHPQKRVGDLYQIFCLHLSTLLPVVLVNFLPLWGFVF